MKGYVKQSYKDYELIALARDIIAHVPPKDWPGEVDAIRMWVMRNVRYTRDPYDLETIQTPINTINLRHGDCDDQAILVATLLAAIGAKPRFTAIKQHPRFYCHVFTEVRIGPHWYPVETTEPVDLGWRPQIVGKPMHVHIF